MFKIAVTVAASAWLVNAQEDNYAHHSHGAFAFIRTGERTPILRPGVPSLTALGAQQMVQLGQNFRTRYIAGNSPNGFGIQHIPNMSQNTLDNNQILIQTLDQPHLVASAQAFMQGLYPPTSIANGNGTGSAVGGLLSDGRAIDYPLNGYQYANIQTFGPQDPGSIFISGTDSCPTAKRDAMMYFTTSKFMDTLKSTKDFYKNNIQAEWLDGYLGADKIDYTYALEVADYIQYQYAHNSRISSSLSNTTMRQLRTLADEQAWYLWGNTSASSTDADNQAISGKTLASTILGSFKQIIADNLNGGDTSDMSYPLTFFLGDHHPFISLLSLMMTDYKDPGFRSIPPFASTMVFELFSTGNSSAFPSNPDNLWIDFYFHNGSTTSPSDFSAKQFLAFPIFGSARSMTSMRWPVFQDLMARTMLNTLSNWCDTCNAQTLFCTGVKSSSSSLSNTDPSRRNSMSPALGGLIGALTTLAVAALLALLATLLCGVRFHRVPSPLLKTKSPLSAAGAGGFKGSRKLASDPDLSIAKNGVPPAVVGLSFDNQNAAAAGERRHERMGSWELRAKEGRMENVVEEEEGRESLDLGARPVVPSERV